MVRAETQFTFKTKSQEGVATTPVAADVLTLREDPTYTPNVTFSADSTAPGQQAKNRTVASRSEASVTGSTWLIGSRAPAVLPSETPPPPVDSLLRAGGLGRSNLDYLYVSTNSASGSFVRGDAITWDGGGSGTVVNFAIPRNGNALLVIDTADAAQANDTFTCAATSVTQVAAANGSRRRAYLYTPTSRSTVLVTATHANWTGATPAVGDLLVRTNTAASAALTGWEARDARIVAVSGSGTTRVFEVEVHSSDGFAVGHRVSVLYASGSLYGGGGAAPTVTAIDLGTSPPGDATLRDPGIVRTVTDARLTFGLQGQAGGEVGLTFELRGSMSEPTVGEHISGAAYVQASDAPRLELAAVVWDGRPLAGQTLEYSHQGELAARTDYHKINGVGAVRRTGRSPQITCDPVEPSPAIYSLTGKMLGSTSVVFAAQIGNTAGNLFIIEIPAGQIIAASPGVRDGERVSNVTLAARANGTDNDVRIYAL